VKKAAYSIAVVGATGLVGQEILERLDERGFPVGALQLYASARTAGDEVRCAGVSARVELLDGARFDDTDLVFLAAGEQVSAEWVPRATDAGAVVIDTSQLFANDADVPLVVPEVNADNLTDYGQRGLVASPDSAAVAMSIVLKPLQATGMLKRIVACTVEPVSGAGRAGIEELQQQTIELMSGRSVDAALFPHRIAFNLVPQVGDLLDGGASQGEQQTTDALRRLLDDADLSVSVTRVRAPFFYGAAIALSVETVDAMTAADVRQALRAAPGILLHDEIAPASYSTPADAVGQDAICVSRIRADAAGNVLDLWVVFDNLRKGCAANAVQIAEILVRDHL
jgi:aspartate-semialdehyde dehydrogenase